VVVIVALVTLLTDDVLIVKIADELPDGIVSDAGTEAPPTALLFKATATPVPAVTLIATVPVTDPVPPTIEAVLSERLVTLTGLTVTTAVFESPPEVAVMVTSELVATLFDVTIKVVEVARNGIVTLAGTVAAFVLLLESVTVNPPSGAGAPIVTVPVELP
jgi:hypothetical protein